MRLPCSQACTGWRMRSGGLPGEVMLVRLGRPIPIKAEQRPLLVSESGTPLTKSALDSAWQRLVRRAVAEDVIEKDQRFALHGLEHRGITDSEDKSAGGHVTEAMRQLYDHSVPVVKAAVKPKKKG
ncbi:hypothetical protein JY412_19640 [Stenotrophomonas maltophilia]|nr:hypothetical protein [Stenotrophomonas maltophilia]MBN5165767.1 hypothetical protein [Stenotrophomonas maltophilia]HDX0836661.1 hypothetical protein [Stenotrophomonas maltophilia]HEL5323897.1 hypothetical protein [Stenotrophomonas maltophilia]